MRQDVAPLRQVVAALDCDLPKQGQLSQGLVLSGRPLGVDPGVDVGLALIEAAALWPVVLPSKGSPAIGLRLVSLTSPLAVGERNYPMLLVFAVDWLTHLASLPSVAFQSNPTHPSSLGIVGPS